MKLVLREFSISVKRWNIVTVLGESVLLKLKKYFEETRETGN